MFYSYENFKTDLVNITRTLRSNPAGFYSNIFASTRADVIAYAASYANCSLLESKQHLSTIDACLNSPVAN